MARRTPEFIYRLSVTAAQGPMAASHLHPMHQNATVSSYYCCNIWFRLSFFCCFVFSLGPLPAEGAVHGNVAPPLSRS